MLLEEDMVDLIIMYEARIKGLKVYGILFDKPNTLPPALTTKEGVFGAFTRIESIIIRHSKLDVDMTLDVLESDRRVCRAESKNDIMNSIKKSAVARFSR